MARVVILGGGLTGLSTAYHLQKNNFFDFKVFEKDSSFGGLARSVKQDGFTFDYTGHLLHSNNNYFDHFLEQFLPQRDCVSRKSFVFTHNRFIPYPIQMNLKNLPHNVMAECFCGFVKKGITFHERTELKNPQNFYEWVLKHFGPGLGKHFFFPYNEKLLCFPSEKIHPSWTGRFVPKTTIKKILKTFCETSSSKGITFHVGYNHHFYYPKKGGIQKLVENICAEIKKNNEKNMLDTTSFFRNYKAVFIDLKEKTVIFENGHTEKYETLVTTLPLKIFLQLIREPSSSNLKKNHEHLLCNSVTNFNIGFKKQSANKKNQPHSNKHWIYVPEKKYQFYRVGFWHNISKSLCPPNHGSLYGEISNLNHHQPNKKNIFKSKHIDESIEKACTIFNISKQDICTQKTLFIDHAYVIYDAWRSKNINKIHEKLNSYSVYSIGRYGEWKYSSMQEAILDGKEMANNIEKKLHIKVSPSMSANILPITPPQKVSPSKKDTPAIKE